MSRHKGINSNQILHNSENSENDKKKYEGKFLAFKRVGVLLSLIIILQAFSSSGYLHELAGDEYFSLAYILSSLYTQFLYILISPPLPTDLPI